MGIPSTVSRALYLGAVCLVLLALAGFVAATEQAPPAVEAAEGSCPPPGLLHPGATPMSCVDSECQTQCQQEGWPGGSCDVDGSCLCFDDPCTDSECNQTCVNDGFFGGSCDIDGSCLCME